MDPDILRTRWLQVYIRNAIPRPINVATLILHRPPSVRVPGDSFQITVARFDDPLTLPGDIETHWTDLRMSSWRLFQGHQSLSDALSTDQSGWNYFLLNGRELTTPSFPFGIIEVVSVHQNDDNSVGFLAVLPSTASWIHLWNWLHFGMGFPEGFTFRIVANGVPVTLPDIPFQLQHGFFLQIFAYAHDDGPLMVIPPMRLRSWSRVLCYAHPSATGAVYKASRIMEDSELARLPYQNREDAILNRWPSLTVWGSYKVHSAGRSRSQPTMVNFG